MRDVSRIAHRLCALSLFLAACHDASPGPALIGSKTSKGTAQSLGAPQKTAQVVPAWPRTVGAAVDTILAHLDEKSKATVRSTAEGDLIRFHHGWGTGIRNAFGLWQGNADLLSSCGGAGIHPDDCSMVIIHQVWKRLQTP